MSKKNNKQTRRNRRQADLENEKAEHQKRQLALAKTQEKLVLKGITKKPVKRKAIRIRKGVRVKVEISWLSSAHAVVCHEVLGGIQTTHTPTLRMCSGDHDQIGGQGPITPAACLPPMLACSVCRPGMSRFVGMPRTLITALAPGADAPGPLIGAGS
ncbi:hypothetical protein HaLaN_22686, partial [Haematococcus lacustris]